jgi:sugar-specific transcriptional regulator TrmB
MNLDILKKIGLTDGEIKTYLALLKLGQSSTGPIAKMSGVSRSKLYPILEKLEKKGLCSHIEKNKINYYHAVEPSKVKDYLNEKREEINKLEKEFVVFLPNLEAYYKQKDEGTKVNIYQGFKGIKVTHEHIYLKLKKGDEYQVMSIPPFVSEKENLYYKKDHSTRVKSGIKCRLLFINTVDKSILKERNKYKFCEARYMPSQTNAPVDYTTYADTTIIRIASHEPVAIEIVSQDVTDSFKDYFEGYWKRSKAFKE